MIKKLIIALTVSLQFSYCLGLFNKKTKAAEDDKFAGEVFCRNESRLIRLERFGEIVVVGVPEGTDILLQCKFCDASDSREGRIWFRQNITSGFATQFSNDSSAPEDFSVKSGFRLTKRNSMILKNVSMTHSGLYLCRLPYDDALDSSYNYILDTTVTTIPTESGSLQQWRNYSDHYLIPANTELHNFTFSYTDTLLVFKYQVFSSWSPWSKCETCVTSPQQWRVAYCRVRPVCVGDVCSKKGNNNEHDVAHMELPQLLISTSTSLPCHGHLLSFYLPYVAQLVREIPNFREVRNCEAQCPLKGDPDGPMERRNILLNQGEHLTMICPGFKGDRNVVWSYNKLKLKPVSSYIDGHILVDNFGTIYLHDVLPKMKGKYSCKVEEDLIFEMILSVNRIDEIFGEDFLRHLLYLIFVATFCFTLLCAIFVVKGLRLRRLRKKNIYLNWESDISSEPLLSWQTEDEYDYEDTTYSYFTQDVESDSEEGEEFETGGSTEQT